MLKNLYKLYDLCLLQEWLLNYVWGWLCEKVKGRAVDVMKG